MDEKVTRMDSFYFMKKYFSDIFHQYLEDVHIPFFIHYVLCICSLLYYIYMYYMYLYV